MRISPQKQMLLKKTAVHLSRILPLFFVIGGACGLYFGCRIVLRARASASWPHVTGRVVSSSVGSDHGDGSITYQAKIRYEFSVNATTFNGDRVAYGDQSSSNRSRAERIAGRYPEGRDVKVYYIPSDPKECVLEPGMQTQALFFPGFASIFFIIGIVMLVRSFKAAGKSEEPAQPGAPEDA